MTFESVRSSGAHPAVGDFTWHRLGKPEMTGAQIADKGRRSIRRLTAWGVEVPPNCRLVRATELVESSLDADVARALDSHGRDKVGEAARTLFEFYIITHCMKKPPGDAVLLDKLADALSGADVPVDEEAHSARDTQFELYVWGLLNATGSPCSFVEPPDLACRYGDEKIGIAVKRVWSLDQTKKRLSLAARQIARSRLRGFIAVSAQEFLTAEAGVPDLLEKGNAYNRDVARLHGHFPYLARKAHVLGATVIGATYRWDVPEVGQVHLGVTVWHQDFSWADTEEEERVFLGFTNARMSGLRDWMQQNL